MSGRKLGGLGAAALLALGVLGRVFGSRPGAAPEVRAAAASAPIAAPHEAPVQAPAQADAAVPSAIPAATAPVAGEPRRVAPAPEPDPPSPEEIEHRRAFAARIRKLIAAGPNAVAPPVVSGGVLAQGDPHPVYVAGELRGVALENVPVDGLYGRLGLREGDLVQSVNGIGLAETVPLLQEITGAETFELAIEHGDGTQGSVKMTRDQILQELQNLE